MTTKAERIRQLLDAGMCNTMIADIVQCREEYVRTVKQRLDPVRRKQDVARHLAKRKTGDKTVANRSYRLHYREARKSGLSPRQAHIKAAIARNSALYATGDLAAARAAYHAAKRGTSHA